MWLRWSVFRIFSWSQQKGYGMLTFGKRGETAQPRPSKARYTLGTASNPGTTNDCNDTYQQWGIWQARPTEVHRKGRKELLFPAVKVRLRFLSPPSILTR